MACTDEMADCVAALRIYLTHWLARQYENYERMLGQSAKVTRFSANQTHRM